VREREKKIDKEDRGREGMREGGREEGKANCFDIHMRFEKARK